MNVYYAVAKKKTRGYPVGAIFKVFKQANDIVYAQKQNFAVDAETMKTRGVGIGELFAYTIESARSIFTTPIVKIEDAIEQSIMISEATYC